MEQEQRSAETRESIETVCLKLFAKQGVLETSLDEIAQKAGISKGAIYWHYQSKEVLVQAVLLRAKLAWQDIIPLGIDQTKIAEERLRLLFRNYLVLLTKHHDLSLFFQRIRLETKAPFAASVGKFFSESAAFVGEVIAYGVSTKAFTAPKDLHLLSYHIISSLAGAHAQWLSDHDLNLPGLVEEIEEGVRLRLGVPPLHEPIARQKQKRS